MKTRIQNLFLVVALLAGLTQTARAVVAFTVTPAAVSNTYSGLITLSIGGLTNTETVVVQKFLDLNTNGVIDGTDWLVQQFALQDGTNFVIGGVTNFNVPGDLNATPGAITAQLNFQNGDFAQNIIGKYLFKLSSPVSHFAPLTNQFAVTNFPFAQKITGNVVSNGTSTTLSNAVVLLMPGPNSSPVAGAVANNAGSYTIQMPPGTYMPVAFENNYAANMNTAPVLTLAASQTITTNLTLTNATASISGNVVDANNSSIGLPGVMVPAQANGLIAITFTDTNGNFNVPVTAGTWEIKADDMGLIVHGYLGLQNGTNVNAGATGVTLAVPKATALIYGSVKDNLGNPMAGIDVYAYDNNNQYQTDAYTDANGKYVAGVLGGLGGNDPWSLQISGDSSPTNYLFSQPAFAQNGGTNLSVGATVQVKFTALLATNHITGSLKDNSGNPIANVGVWASATINGVGFNQGSASTDTNGNYWLNVASGTWTVGVSTGGSDGLPGNYFPPDSQSVVISNNNGTANFIALLPANHISGWLKDSGGNPIVGVMVWANATINSINYFQSVNTDASGNYSLGVINGSWMVGVEQGGGGNSLPGNYVAPANQTVLITNNNSTVNLTALSATNHIAGWLKDTSGNPIAGVGVWANATINGVDYSQGTVNTDGSGNYSLNVANGTWSVGVNSGGGGNSLPVNYLSPANQSVVISNNNGTANFTTLLATNHITGHIQQANSNPIGNVGVWASATINSVNYNQYVDADGSGNYSLNVANGSWMVGIECGSNGGDGLDDILGSGNYMCPDNQTVTINNNNGTANFTVQPCNGVQIFTTSLPDGQVGSYYDQFLQGSTCSGTLNWSLNDPQDFPSSLNFDSDGEIFGTPDTAGIYNFSVHLDDGNGNSTDQNLSLYIAPASTPLQVTTTFLAPGQKGVYYSQPFLATGGQPPYQWSLSPLSASLTPNLVLTANGVISGTPATNGTSFFSVRVTDSASATADQALSLSVYSGTPVTIMLKSDASTLAAAVGPGAPSADLFTRLDSGNLSNLTFQTAVVGAFGTFTPIPSGAPAGTQVINILPGDGENGFFKISFVLPVGFQAIQLAGAANVDDYGRAFLNGNPISSSMSSGDPGRISESGDTSFSTASAAFFRAGTNELVIADANTGGGPSGAAFYAAVTYQTSTNNSGLVLGLPSWLTNQFQMRLTGASNQNYTVQMSTNLSSTNWISLFITNNTTTNSFNVIDLNATNNQRFYRVLVGP